MAKRGGELGMLLAVLQALGIRLELPPLPPPSRYARRRARRRLEREAQDHPAPPRRVRDLGDADVLE